MSPDHIILKVHYIINENNNGTSPSHAGLGKLNLNHTLTEYPVNL